MRLIYSVKNIQRKHTLSRVRSRNWSVNVILLDEATAALDEPTEALLYRALKQKLPQSIIISIGHRSTLNEFHDFSLDVGNAACD